MSDVPSSLPALIIWARSDLNDGRRWPDKSGNGNHLTHRRVVLNASNAQFNNLPCLVFDGAKEIDGDSVSKRAIPTDFTNGFTLLTSMRLNPPPPGGGRAGVIYQIGSPGDGPRLTVAIDSQSRITLGFCDANGHESEQIVAPLAPDHFSSVLCELRPVGKGLWRLAIEVDGRCASESEPHHVCMSGKPVDQLMSLSLDIWGKRPAAFSINGFAVYNRALNDEEKSSVYADAEAWRKAFAEKDGGK